MAERRIMSRSSFLAAGLAVALVWIVGALAADTAKAEVGIHTFNAFPTSAQAGSHPNVYIEFNIDNRNSPQLPDPDNPGKFLPCACNEAKDIVIDFPPGFIGNPHATPQCNAKEFAFNECSIDSQIGMVNPKGCLHANTCDGVVEPVYNLIPPPDVAGLTGFKVALLNNPLFINLTSRTGSDYGLRATVSGSPRVFPLLSFTQEIWGVPADPANDAHRFNQVCIELCNLGPPLTGHPSNSPLVPFLSNPTTCGVPLTTTMKVVAYDHEVTGATAAWPETTGCSQLDFNPSLSANPTTTKADTPSGIDVDLTVPQALSPTTPSPSSIRATTVTLPAGFSINPNAADGKTSCSDISAKFGTEDQAQCPEFAKVGTIGIHSAVLPDTLPGAVYIGDPQPGNRYRLFLVADGFGVHVKLPGSVFPDPQTGQLVVSFQDLPQTPFERFNLHFFGSERGILATPSRCGTYPVVTTFTPWNSALEDQRSTQFFEIDSGPDGSPCPGATRPFTPAFGASSVGNIAGDYSPFTVRLSRADGNQNLTGLRVSTPVGFSGKLAGIPNCPESALTALASGSYSGLAELASPTCPAASRIGTATAGTGAGSRPLYVPGHVFLAGPYKGAPLSLAAVVPAVSGPYDLGNVVVRAAIHVDPVTARVTTVTDPLPQILEGIPLRTRFIQVDLDRPSFALNPTNCGQLSTDAQIFGDEGATSAISSPFHVANCAIMPFAPKLRISLTGGVNRRGHPAVHAVLTAKPGEANLRRVSVALPRNELLDNAHVDTICTRPAFARDICPAGSRLGTAEATTPLLDAPLRGDVYLRSSSNELPDLAIDLEGQIDIELAGKIDTLKGGSLRTTFNLIPDAPITQFRLDLLGGDKGLLINSKSLCAADKKAIVKMAGQNRAVLAQKVKVRTSCGSKSRPRHRNSKGRG